MSKRPNKAPQYNAGIGPAILDGADSYQTFVIVRESAGFLLNRPPAHGFCVSL